MTTKGVIKVAEWCGRSDMYYCGVKQHQPKHLLIIKTKKDYVDR